MKRIFKKYFVPHAENEYKPHLLRKNASIIIAACAILIELTLLGRLYVLQPGENFLASILPNVLVDLTNASRLSDAKPSLNINFILQEAATLKARDMAAKGYFSHISPDGTAPWYWLQQVGYSYAAAGENLAVNFSDSEDVIRAWMNSEGHKKNILNQKFSEIGIGIASGVYKGRESVFIVQFFGKPALTAVAKTPALTPAPSVTPAAQDAPKQIALEEVRSVDMFIETAESAADSNVPAANQNLAASPAPQVSTLAMRFLAMPKTFTGYVLSALLALIVLTLALKIFIKIRVQHPALIANGLFIIAVILSLMIANKHLLASTLQIL